MPAITSENLIWIVTGFIGFSVLMFICILLCYRKPSQGQAIIRSGFGGTFVSFSGKIVMPILQKARYLDITLKRLVIDLQGSEALTCKGGTQADVKAAFFVRVNPTVEDVKKVVQKLGIEKAADVETLNEMFNTQFIEALKNVSKNYSYEELTNREMFKEKVIAALPTSLDGYILDTVTIDYLEKTQTA